MVETAMVDGTTVLIEVLGTLLEEQDSWDSTSFAHGMTRLGGKQTTYVEDLAQFTVQ